MVNLLGSYSHSIDDKGRLMLPVKYRTALKKNVVISLHYDNNLAIRSIQEFEKFQEKVLSLPETQSDVRKFRHLIFGNSFELSLDSQGRINIPDQLLELSKIKKEIQIVGSGSYLELWAKNKWIKFMNESISKGHLNDIADKINV